MIQERTDDLNPNTSSNREKMLFENILHDFKVDAKIDRQVSRSLSDYYFDIMETFKLESLLAGKILNNAQTVILFDAVSQTGDKLDIYYHKGNVRRISDFSQEMGKWRRAFLDVSELRDRLYKEMIQDISKTKSTSDNVTPEDRHEFDLIQKMDEALVITTESLLLEYGK